MVRLDPPGGSGLQSPSQGVNYICKVPFARWGDILTWTSLRGGYPFAHHSMHKFKPCSSNSFALAEMPGDQDGARCNLRLQPWAPWPRADNMVETVTMNIIAKVYTTLG